MVVDKIIADDKNRYTNYEKVLLSKLKDEE